MSRRQRLRGQRRSPPPSLLRRWTLARATGLGILFGLAALLVAGIAGTGGAIRPVYATLLVATLLCGISVLWITASDMRTRGTSGRMRPIRGFDAAVGFALLLPAGYALSEIWPELGL